MRAGRVFEMVRKELLQLGREPRLRRLIVLSPIIQLVVFGYAVTTDYRETATFVVDHDRSSASRELLQAFTASDYFRLVGSSGDEADLMAALDHSRAVLGIVVPPEFGEDLGAGREARIQLLFDGTNSNLATVARGYALSIAESFAARSGPQAGPPAIALEERAWFNPNLRSRDYNVPAVMGSILLIICLLLTSLAVVRERELGTLEQLMVSPLTPLELIAGKTIPFALIGLLDLGLISAVALLWFGVPFRGNFLFLIGASLLYVVCGLGIGLLVSTSARTQQEAFMTTFLIVMPTILLSGFMFPVSSMPPFFRWLTLLNPMRHYMEVVRGVFLKGAGPAALWRQLTALVVTAVGVLWLAAKRFHKRL
jgi:drug efflux transport system permease protein